MDSEQVFTELLQDLPATRRARFIRFLCSVWIANLRGHRHLDFPKDDQVYPLAAKELKAALGSDYPRLIRPFFHVVDRNFSKASGRCMPHRIRPGVDAFIRGLVASPEKSPPPLPSESNVYSPVVRVGPLEELISSPRLHKANQLTAEHLLARSHDNMDGTATIFERYAPRKNSPRLYAYGIALQNTDVQIRRHILAGLSYHDIDIVNAHPVLLNQATDRQYDALNDYVENRKAWLAVASRDLGVSEKAAKETFRGLTNGMSPAPKSLSRRLKKRIDQTPNYLTNYSKQVREAGSTLLRDYDGMGLADHIGRYTKRIAFLLQKYETEVLQACLRFHLEIEPGATVRVLLHDGYLYQGHSIDPTVLSDWVLGMTGWQVSFTAEPIQ